MLGRCPVCCCSSVRAVADRFSFKVFCYLVFSSCWHLSQAELRVQEENRLYMIENRKGLHIHRDWGKCSLLNPGLVVKLGDEPALKIQSFLNPGCHEALGPRPEPYDPYKIR